MAEQDAHQRTADIKEEDMQSTNMDCVSANYKSKPEETNITELISKDSASSSASSNRMSETNNDEDMAQGDVQKRDSAEDKTEGSSPDDYTVQNVEGNSTPPQADDRSHGDSREGQKNEQPTMTVLSGENHMAENKAPQATILPTLDDQVDGHKAGLDEETPGTNNTTSEGEYHMGENKAPLATILPTLGDRKDDQVDGHKAGLDEETPGTNNTTSEGEYHMGENKAPLATILPTLGDRKDDQVDGHKAGLDEETPGTNNTTSEEDDGVLVTPEEEMDVQEDTVSPQTTVLPQISVTEETDKRTTNVEKIGPTTEQDSGEPIVPADTGILGGKKQLLICLCIGVVLAILVQHIRHPESPPQKNDTQKIDIFLEQMEKLKARFPNQRAELWNRSKIHLLKHLRAAQPTEPVSLILTAGIKAEKTLQCLAHGLSSAFSSALNASVLHIDGASKARQDSDQVKLDIDNNLQGAFEGDKPVAVIHRFEELPPGSTLIFYRYCDHENAAYKKTCLMFTVLLGEEEISTNSQLSIVEELVDDHLKKKFLTDGHPVSFDRMDLDKYGGLWSRISHLILPVAAEERIEHEGCSET